jgi:FtsP/CotA-like multicopper oxidase with cupredoxin domain
MTSRVQVHSVPEVIGPPRRWRRRVVLALSAVLLAGLAAGGVVLTMYRAALRSNIGDLEFRNRVHIPALIEPPLDPAGRRVFELDIQASRRKFRAGTQTATWGMNGGYLGPTLRAGRGEDVLLNVSNGLGETRAEGPSRRPKGTPVDITSACWKRT